VQGRQMWNNYVPNCRDTGWGVISPDLHDLCHSITGAGTGKALGISHGIEETEPFNNVAFMDEYWSNMRLNIGKTVV
jgi:hypothetical protein